jgi:hypothetical protein
MSKICWLPTIAIVLVACNPKQQPAPDAETDVTEAIEFELIRALDAQGQFRLSNQTSQPISFRASDENAEGVHPEDAQLKCKPAGSDQWDEGPRPMGDSEVDSVELSPGSQKTLIVLWEPGLIEAYAGGHCRVDLRLGDGSIIESAEFSL